MVHAAWQTDAQAAVQVVLAATRRARTPEPLRRARTLARTRRAHPRCDGRAGLLFAARLWVVLLGRWQGMRQFRRLACRTDTKVTGNG